MANMNNKILMLSLVAIAFVGGVVMAAPNEEKVKGYNEFGYNEVAEAFNGCYTNYLNWKDGRPAVGCNETIETTVHAKWKFDKEGSLMWVLNLWYYPTTGQTALVKIVTIGQEDCAAVGGQWRGDQIVTQTGDIVPVCRILWEIEGEEPLVIATPPGFGYYKNE